MSPYWESNIFGLRLSYNKKGGSKGWQNQDDGEKFTIWKKVNKGQKKDSNPRSNIKGETKSAPNCKISSNQRPNHPSNCQTSFLDPQSCAKPTCVLKHPTKILTWKFPKSSFIFWTIEYFQFQELERKCSESEYKCKIDLDLYRLRSQDRNTNSNCLDAKKEILKSWILGIYFTFFRQPNSTI